MMVVWYTHNKYRYPGGTVASTGSKIDTHKKVVQWGNLCFYVSRPVFMYEGTTYFFSYYTLLVLVYM